MGSLLEVAAVATLFVAVGAFKRPSVGRAVGSRFAGRIVSSLAAGLLLAAVGLMVFQGAGVGAAWAQESSPTSNVFTEDWTGADGAAWEASRWATDGGTSATADILSNQGRMRFENVSGARARAIATMPKRTNTEVLASFRFPSTGAKGLLQIFSRASGDWPGGYPGSGYYVELTNSGTNVGLRKVSSGTITELANASVGQATTAKQWVRFRVEGSTLQAKVWADGTQEPAGWEIQATDASFSAPGVLQLRWARSSTATDAREVLLDDLTVKDADPNSQPLSAPSGLSATAASSSKIDLSWTDNATNEGAYTVERSPNGSTGWTELTSTLPADATSYSDANLNPATTYHYRVMATNATGGSGYSNTASATTHASGPTYLGLTRNSDDTAEANGRVWAMVRAGDRIYVGGNFTALRSKDGQTIARSYLAAVDANTGEVVGDWNVNPNGSVRALAVSPDGSRLYVGGTFTDVDGLTRNRLAAINLATGTVDSRWNAGANSKVMALTVSGNTLFAGGNFTTVKGQPRTHLAKVDGLTGALDSSWSPSADGITDYGSVRALAFSEDGSRLYVGGYFGSISGQQTGNLAALDPITGALDGGFRPNESHGILSLAVSGGRVFAGSGDHLEGIEAFDGATGQRYWRLGYGDHSAGTGDVQALTVRNGILYAGGHFDKMDDQTRHRLLAVDATTGVIDSQWTPKLPTTNGDLGVWAMAWYGPYLYVGGDFTTISGQAQERIGRFTERAGQPVRGLTGEYFDNIDFSGTKMTRTDPTVDYDWLSYAPPGIGANTFSARWTGQVEAAYSEPYSFYTISDDGVRVWLNGQLIINNWTDHGPTENSSPQVTLAAGQRYDIKMEYYENSGGAVARLGWNSARQGKQIIPQSQLYPAVVSP